MSASALRDQACAQGEAAFRDGDDEAVPREHAGLRAHADGVDTREDGDLGKHRERVSVTRTP